MQATYKSLYSDVGYWFQDDGKRSIDRGFVGYRLNANANLQLGRRSNPSAWSLIRNLAGATTCRFSWATR